MDVTDNDGYMPKIDTVEKILQFIDDRPANRNQIHEELGVDWRSLNNGLAWMRERGLVVAKEREDKNWCYYEKNDSIEKQVEKLDVEDELPDVEEVL